ncbi:putative 2-aminoethylphosphonate ABC transporter ATP-binding protein [Vreelandella venusta]|uniref:2-aminoethylphosphonate ABC transporter ATP-binding protein n=1 Tax=Vreelandella venusta TaxID=44935 RepID=A0ABX2BB24_9GAMM|nr:putative 2-aminoethylphosphonate ABC transporter ATP-binding protein [Halomonas venusta]AZM97441.1 putative 2-aminoethylphosphonate ABC transporter ATP-binding protein [Halomonas venusta]MDW0358840.1 putative 2-aminoethylphosphonate ABC transporter ATP-binding protein [Halomonas venusta]NPT31325.1 putative 2-aminoethylphosphonate ABC transporter ATP-binding protein [Halomonas venusta]
MQTTLTSPLTAHSAAKTLSPSAHLSIDGVTKRFGSFTALDNIALQIQEGEFVCFLGPSGCGKTTLLRTIAGLAQQTAGSLIQRGKDISTLPPQARDFGIVFQSYALFPNLTVFDNVAYGLCNRRSDRTAIAARVAELLALVDLSGSEYKYPAALSGGQQQRVALARALATEPGLLLLDEPLSALDARVRGHLRHQIKALQARLGVTTIMVTHDQEEALTMADRIVVMNHGVIEQVGTPAEIYHQPASAFVASFIGTMNFLEVTAQANNHALLGTTLCPCLPHAYTQGQAAQLAIRPEAVALSASAGELSGDVMDIEFLGAFQRVSLRLNNTEQWLLADVPSRDSATLGLQLGQTLGVHLPADAARLYPAGSNQS